MKVTPVVLWSCGEILEPFTRRWSLRSNLAKIVCPLRKQPQSLHITAAFVKAGASLHVPKAAMDGRKLRRQRNFSLPAAQVHRLFGFSTGRLGLGAAERDLLLQVARQSRAVGQGVARNLPAHLRLDTNCRSFLLRSDLSLSPAFLC